MHQSQHQVQHAATVTQALDCAIVMTNDVTSLHILPFQYDSYFLLRQLMSGDIPQKSKCFQNKTNIAVSIGCRLW